MLLYLLLLMHQISYVLFYNIYIRATATTTAICYIVYCLKYIVSIAANGSGMPSSLCKISFCATVTTICAIFVVIVAATATATATDSADSSAATTDDDDDDDYYYYVGKYDLPSNANLNLVLFILLLIFVPNNEF